MQNRYDSSTAAAFRAVQKSGEMVVRTLDPRQFIRLASETAPKINIDTNVSPFFLIYNLRTLFPSCFSVKLFTPKINILTPTYRKVASSRLSQLVAHPRIFRLFMKGKYDAYTRAQNVWSGWPVYEVKCLCSRGQE